MWLFYTLVDDLLDFNLVEVEGSREEGLSRTSADSLRENERNINLKKNLIFFYKIIKKLFFLLILFLIIILVLSFFKNEDVYEVNISGNDSDYNENLKDNDLDSFQIIFFNQIKDYMSRSNVISKDFQNCIELTSFLEENLIHNIVDNYFYYKGEYIYFIYSSVNLDYCFKTQDNSCCFFKNYVSRENYSYSNITTDEKILFDLLKDKILTQEINIKDFNICQDLLFDLVDLEIINKISSNNFIFNDTVLNNRVNDFDGRYCFNTLLESCCFEINYVPNESYTYSDKNLDEHIFYDVVLDLENRNKDPKDFLFCNNFSTYLIEKNLIQSFEESEDFFIYKEFLFNFNRVFYNNSFCFNVEKESCCFSKFGS